MDMFPHVVTVYNTYVETDHSTFEETTVNHITVLRGVLLDASKGSNVTKSGLESAVMSGKILYCHWGWMEEKWMKRM